jgi:hypothetical protein
VQHGVIPTIRRDVLHEKRERGRDIRRIAKQRDQCEI